jgi:hypothetical protein
MYCDKKRSGFALLNIFISPFGKLHDEQLGQLVNQLLVCVHDWVSTFKGLCHESVEPPTGNMSS